MRKCSVISKDLERWPSTASEWRVWHVIHLHHSLERGAFPAEKTLCDTTHLSRSTLHRAINGLLEADLMRVSRRGRRRVYCLPVDEHNVLTGRWNVSCLRHQCPIYATTESHSCDFNVPSVNSECPTNGTTSLTPAPVELSYEHTKEVSEEHTTPAACPEICTSASGEPETPRSSRDREEEQVEKNRKYREDNPALVVEARRLARK
jgi:hypothetical protein